MNTVTRRVRFSIQKLKPGKNDPMAAQTDPQETIAYRLSELLRRLNEGQKLDPHALTQEFGVNLRTVQRDLNERLAFLELEKHNGHYRISGPRLGLLTQQDVERFASVAGLQGLHPRLGSELLKDLLDSRLQSLQIRGHHYEDLSGREDSFRQLKQAIEQRQTVSFRYRKPEGEKLVQGAQPYRLVNQSGIWYLAANDGGTLKSYTFTKMNGLLVEREQHFEPDPAMVARLEQEDSIWLNAQKTEVVLKIGRDAAGYFQRRQLIAGQKIEKELADGGLLVSCLIAHPNQILPTVRYWLPHVRIISPEGLQAELEQQLQAYLGLA